jgi:DNA repair exonuclease SbcCD ATPase subunit
MRQLRVDYIAAENFLCFGPEGIEIDLTKYGNIVLVRGENMDVSPDATEEERKSSNGVGKSSIPEIIVYTIFGKTIKNPKKLSHGNIINNQVGKKLQTEVRFDNLKIVRTRKPDSLRVWEKVEGAAGPFFGPYIVCPQTGENIPVKGKTDGVAKNAAGDEVAYSEDDVKDSEITLGGMPATQKMIEDRIGLTYETFVNLVVFTDNNAGSFLECDTPTKREIVENLLSLDRYRSYHEEAKKLRNAAKERIKDAGRTLELAISDFEASKRRIAQIEQQEANWKKQKQNELNVLAGRVKEKQYQLEKTDTGAALSKYEQAQEQIASLRDKLPVIEENLTKIKNVLDEGRSRQEHTRQLRDAANLIVNQLELDVKGTKNVIKMNREIIENVEAQRCKFCNKIDEDAVTRAQAVIAVSQTELEEFEAKLVKERADLTKYNETLTKLKDFITQGETKSRDFTKEIDQIRKGIAEFSKVEKPEISANDQLLKEQLNDLKQQTLAKLAELEGPTPYVEILRSAVEESELKEKECEVKKNDLKDAGKQLPYYEFWVDAFGDTGIRKFIIDGIIPALNSRVAHWLQFLIDGKIKLTFDNELEETIERNPSDGDPFVYHAMSGGEKRRLNLAVAPSFAHILMLNSGINPSILFLDEVTTNVDPVGVQGVYNMIVELSKEKQVFVTTHDHDLLNLLDGCEAINLRKQGGFTTLVQ